jgi:Short C-terminal domain
MLGRGRRMRRRGLVAGAAIANHRRSVEQDMYQQGEYDQQAQDQQYAAQPPAPAPAPAAPAPDPMDAKMAELEKLGRLHESGVLTDEEFAAEKAKILGN